jgi:hypothetical protein
MMLTKLFVAATLVLPEAIRHESMLAHPLHRNLHLSLKASTSKIAA